MSNSSFLVEKLIELVGRAFYSDNYIIILDTLVREKFIREEELGPRLKILSKDIRKIISQLESEMLISYENMIMDDGRVAKCYYINYQLFVHIIRYRIHLLKKQLASTEQTILNDIFYQCPTCLLTYSSLQVQILQNNDYKFVCSNCCPYENYRTAPSESYYILKELDKNSDSIHIMFKKFEYQLYTHIPHHEGILNILADLKDCTVIRNLPSENRKYGITATKVTDNEVLEEITENIGNNIYIIHNTYTHTYTYIYIYNT